MDLACPHCAQRVTVKTTESTDAICENCGLDCGILPQILLACGDSVLLGVEALREERYEDALDFAYESWNLRRNPESTALGLISAMALRDSVEVQRWLNRRLALKRIKD